MPTTEPEILQPVALCLPDGKRLNPAARGWSRKPLHTANLSGRWGRTKKWDYWAILTGDLVISVTYADVDYLGIADVWWCDLATHRSGGHGAHIPLAKGIDLPDRPGSAPLHYDSKAIDLDVVDEPYATTITARWTEADGSPATLEARIDLPPDHESLNVVIPWSDKTFQYTSKHQARAVHGSLTVAGLKREFGTESAPPLRTDAWGVLDVGRGRWPYSTRWNWGGGAGRDVDGCVIGLQFGGKWTEGTGFTENGVLVNGQLTKIGEELTWTYEWERPLRTWRVQHPDGSLDLTLTPTYDKYTKANALVMATEVHQVFGTWSGHVTDQARGVHRIEGIIGFAEESRSRW